MDHLGDLGRDDGLGLGLRRYRRRPRAKLGGQPFDIVEGGAQTTLYIIELLLVGADPEQGRDRKGHGQEREKLGHSPLQREDSTDSTSRAYQTVTFGRIEEDGRADLRRA